MVRLLLLLMVAVLCSGCREELIHVSSELEANKVMLGLRTEGIDARKIYLSKEWVIDVPRSRFTDALRILESKRVLKESSGSESIGNGSDLFSSRQEKEARANKLIASNLSATLRVLPEVLDARVHIYQNTSEPYSLEQSKDRTASVLLVVQSASSLEVEQVKELVSQGGGVPPSKVSVVVVSDDHPDISGKKEEVVDETVSREATSFVEVVRDIPLERKIYVIGGVVCLVLSGILISGRRRKKRDMTVHNDLSSFLDEKHED